MLMPLVAASSGRWEDVASMKAHDRLLVGLLVVVAGACSSDDTPARPAGSGCAIASDCTDPLVCAYQRCHAQCNSSKDCPPGQNCVGSAFPKLGVCLLPDETNCERNSDCPSPLICSRKNKCAPQCLGDRDCLGGQVCQQGSCLDVEEASDAASLDGGAKGEPCRYAHECNAPLRCIAGVCAAECFIDRDCRPGEACLESTCRVGASDGGTDATTVDSLVDTAVPSDTKADATVDSAPDTTIPFDAPADAPDGFGRTCVYDSECDPALVCRSGACIQECLAKLDCAPGFDCVSGRCRSPGDACVPTSCAALGLECDTITDGCGKVLYCGSCETGTCGGGGVPNRCGSGVCTPRKCADLGKNCGFVSDGCGKTVGCGTCGASEICSPTNVCVPRSTVPSCAGGGVGAGPSCGVASEDCCASLLVPGGTYNRVDDPSLPATVSDFRLDKFEVTLGRFRAFLAAGKGTQANPPAAGDGAHPLIAGSGWDPAWKSLLPADTAALKAMAAGGLYKETPPDAGYDSNVLNNVSWYVAFAFCAWDGGRLPTEAEWNYAAAGGSEQRIYPWSNPPRSTAVSYDQAICLRSTINYNPSPVGLCPKGIGRFGHLDLGGNIVEWMLDRWVAAITPAACVDCAYLGPGTGRVIRGGGPNTLCEDLKNTLREQHDETNFFSGAMVRVGFRCARSP
jgi:formylglycine-generating enzyme